METNLKRIQLVMLIILAVFSNAILARQTEQNSAESSYLLKSIMRDLPLSWALAVSPDNSLWISHRKGNISRLQATEGVPGEYTVDAISFTPSDLLRDGQGGLLDIIFHPKYLENGWVYLSYSAGTNDANALKIVRFKVVENEVVQLQGVFEVANKKDTPVHYGGRMAFTEDMSLLVTSGDGFDYREQAQVKNSQLGKILRMSDIGAPHPYNPYANDNDEDAAYVLSLGHRNPQGLLVTDEQTIIAHEHGPAGGDEINIIDAGVNYGWPVVTNGKDYSGASISPFKTYKGMQLPNIDWTPSIAPSGMILYQASTFPKLRDHLLVTSLKYQQIYAVPFAQELFAQQFQLLGETPARLRDIEADLSGNIWVLGDGEPATLFKLQSQ